MSPKIHQAFWSDPAVELLEPNHKLALLWFITNTQTNLIGICTSSPKRFSFDTGLPPEVFHSSIKALSRSLVAVGDSVFIRNFIRHQFGTGEKLTSNNVFKGMASAFLGLKDPDLIEVFLKEYPEFKGLTKGLQTPPKGVREEKRREEKSLEGGEGDPKTPEQQADEIYQAYPKKVGKPDALKAIIRALKEDTFDRLLERTKRYAEVRGDDLQFVPNPSTWFNQKRFNDDPSTWSKSSSAPPSVQPKGSTLWDQLG